MTAPAMPASPAEGPLPCPFCGAEPTVHNLAHGGVLWMHPWATDWCPARDAQAYTPTTQAAWNRRVPARANAADVEAVAALKAARDHLILEHDAEIETARLEDRPQMTAYLDKLSDLIDRAGAALAAIGGGAEEP